MLKIYIATILIFLLIFDFAEINAQSLSTLSASFSQAESANRVVRVSDANALDISKITSNASLPIIYRLERDGLNYEVLLESIDIVATGAKAKVSARVEISSSPKQYIYFGKESQEPIKLSNKSGFTGELPILVAQLTTNDNGNNVMEVSIPSLDNKLLLYLNSSTSFVFSCGSFQKLKLSGYAKVNDAKLNAPATGLAFTFENTDVFSWKDMLLEAKSSSQFSNKDYPDLGIKLGASNKVWIDLSEKRNANIAQTCTTELQNTAWQGLYFENFSAVLPPFLHTTSTSSPTVINSLLWGKTRFTRKN